LITSSAFSYAAGSNEPGCEKGRKSNCWNRPPMAVSELLIFLVGLGPKIRRVARKIRLGGTPKR